MHQLRRVVAATLGTVVAAFSAVSVARGQQRSGYEACTSGASTNQDFMRCGGLGEDEADARLNAAWKKVGLCYEKASRDRDAEEIKESKAALLKEQRLWIKWKEAACEYYHTGFGREGVVSSMPACKVAIIADRTKDLETLADELCAP